VSDTPRARKVNIEVTGSAVDESLVKEAYREPVIGPALETAR
jgi:hypothetical protein